MSSGPGLDHVQFRHASLGALLDRYEILRDLGIKPHRTMNHGPSTSFYYRDPDGNGVELYRDRPDSEWSRAEDGTIAMQTRPLDLPALLR